MLRYKTKPIRKYSLDIRTQNVLQKSVIPLKLFQCWHSLDLPPNMKETVELLKRQNPEFEHFLYDDAMCGSFIQHHFDEEVFYTFQKLKPGAYKSDLWRYCILYIHGGVYLDIKYSCVNKFKLIELTDKEYYVKDRLFQFANEPKKIGIYQALLCSLPNNKELWNCIQKIVFNVKHNLYNSNVLDVTGPHIFNSSLLLNSVLSFNGTSIYREKEQKELLRSYSSYREEQHTYTKYRYYATMWKHKDIYHYPTLEANRHIDFTKTCVKEICGKEVLLFSSNTSLVEYGNQYILNQRWINYEYYHNGNKKKIPSQYISLNSRVLLNESLTPIETETFLTEPADAFDSIYVGIEDIRLFQYNNQYYYNGSYYDIKRCITSTSFGLYSLDYPFLLERKIITPSFYDSSVKRIEKNWSFVQYQEKLRMVYQWFPLQIGEIVDSQLNLIETKPMPDYFKDARGSTPGYKQGHEIWFVLHKAQHFIENGEYFFNYQHFFAVFDLNMNLIRYSELFKFGDCRVEFCIGIVVKNDTILLSYSLMDTQSLVSVYDRDKVNRLKWY